jgi:UDP-N-acetylglucosamine transferase subunit ALG13
MILVTVGTNEQPFDRLVEAAAELDAAEGLYVQYGSSTVAHGPGTWVDFVTFEELAQRMRDARVVVCHAGVGSIMLAHRSGIRPIVVPRLLRLGEAVDDHQRPLARRLHERGIVTLVEDTSRLGEAIADARLAVPWHTDVAAMPGAGVLAAELSLQLADLGVSRVERQVVPIVEQQPTLS